ncbi:hypothetical protein GGR50DRAFT_667245 [Xylaria sp. CBS 124048]|nr:hypothetical protein GGR50DRAFT_667245 [Xylaria sp. CBS 124048]
MSSPYPTFNQAGALPLYDHLSHEAAIKLLRRREELHRKLQDGWRAERACLEASRDQNEMLFAEERAMMNEERLLWAAQKAKYEDGVQTWKARAEMAELKLAQLIVLSRQNRSVKPLDLLDQETDGTADSLEVGGYTSPREPLDDTEPTTPPLKPLIQLDTPTQNSSPEYTLSRDEDQLFRRRLYRMYVSPHQSVRDTFPTRNTTSFGNGELPPYAFDAKEMSPPDVDKGRVEAQVEPGEGDDDPALKGPLGLQNRQSSDEIFLRELSDKLEKLRDTGATPAVLGSAAMQESKATEQSPSYNHPEDTTEQPEEVKPLRFRQTSNFGLPFGHVGRQYAP